MPFSISELGHKISISLNVFPSQPALVAKGYIFFPDKSYSFKKEVITGQIVYHHTGDPIIILSYSFRSISISFISIDLSFMELF